MHPYVKVKYLMLGKPPAPLFKKGKVEDMNNYRPISIFSAASKLLGKAVHMQLCDYL